MFYYIPFFVFSFYEIVMGYDIPLLFAKNFAYVLSLSRVIDDREEDNGP